MPTARGPMIVHNTIAQVTTRKRSEGAVDDGDEVGVDGRSKTPVLAANAETRKPISPRATIAQPTIAAGYIEREGRAWLRGVKDFSLSCDVEPLGWVTHGSVVMAEPAESCTAATPSRGMVVVSGAELGAAFWVGRTSSLANQRTGGKSNVGRLKRTNHNPHVTLASAIRMPYTSPRQTTRPLNILVIGIAKPIDA